MFTETALAAASPKRVFCVAFHGPSRISQNLVDSSKDRRAKELPPAERRERVANQAARLKGLRLSGPAECSYASYDLCLKLISDNAISYLAPSKFISRQDELRLEKP